MVRWIVGSAVALGLLGAAALVVRFAAIVAESDLLGDDTGEDA